MFSKSGWSNQFNHWTMISPIRFPLLNHLVICIGYEFGGIDDLTSDLVESGGSWRTKQFKFRPPPFCNHEDPLSTVNGFSAKTQPGNPYLLGSLPNSTILWVHLEPTRCGLYFGEYWFYRLVWPLDPQLSKWHATRLPIIW